MSYGFLDSISTVARASDPAKALSALEEMKKQGLPAEFLSYPRLSDLVGALAGNADFLGLLLVQQAACFELLCQRGPDVLFAQIMDELQQEAEGNASREQVMAALRRARQKVALITAVADITAHWNTIEVTAHLSQFADLAIQSACRHLLLAAHRSGNLKLADETSPVDGSGLIVLAMGKLGACELNYSSDIDLIVLFDAERPAYTGRKSIQHFYNRFAQDLCSLLQERTREGYVFRVDLRLRPDPRSTPLAVDLYSAITYYETLGQNWERAAMIKARVVIGDAPAAELFERSISAYIWRKHLDFEAIADINSIKRQINAKIGDSLSLPGHNVKLGRGGIREIEFFIQTKQLVWGGRDPSLRLRATADALTALCEAEQVEEADAQTLEQSYWYLRRVEHYLQMLDDQQTHSLPEDEAGLKRLATFLGYDDLEAFELELLLCCRAVHDIYARSVASAPPLAVDGNLVFTGVDADPETLKTLERMGFEAPRTVSDCIQSWHRGARRATRSLKARQMLTELVPALLTALSETSNPDHGFMRFDEFIDRVPTGVQIFALLSANPELLKLLTTILGSAPALGDALARNSSLLDIVLEPGFYDDLPDQYALDMELMDHILFTRDYEDCLRVLRQFRQEKQFQAGVQLLKGELTTVQAARLLSDLADVIVKYTHTVTAREFARKHGKIPGAAFAILGLGKLGSQELTFGSDLDLMLVYDAPDEAMVSDGDKRIDAATYFQRLASRLSHAFTLLTKEGELYELDMRLRPGGAKGALATQRQRLEDYYIHEAWDVEVLALTRARVIASSSKTLSGRLHAICLQALDRGYDTSLARSIRELRGKIYAQHPVEDPWRIKRVRGGLMDLDLLAQFFRLTRPQVFTGQLSLSSEAVFTRAQAGGVLAAEDAVRLITHYRLQRDVQHVLRLCSIRQTIDARSPLPLQQLVARLLKRESCDALREELLRTQASVRELFDRLVSE